MDLLTLSRWHADQAMTKVNAGEVEAGAWHEEASRLMMRSVEITDRSADIHGHAFSVEVLLEESAALSADDELSDAQRTWWRALNRRAADMIGPR